MAGGAEAVEDIREVAAPSGGRGIGRPLNQTGAGHQDQYYVAVAEVGAQSTGCLSVVDQLVQVVEGDTAELDQLPLAADRGDEKVCQGAVARLQFTEEDEMPGEPRPRIGIGQRVLAGFDHLAHRVHEDRGDQVPALGEPPVEGGVADPGPAGDLVQRRLEATLGEHGPGSLDQLQAVTLGIGSQARLAGRGRHGVQDTTETGIAPHIHATVEIN